MSIVYAFCFVSVNLFLTFISGHILNALCIQRKSLKKYKNYRIKVLLKGFFQGDVHSLAMVFCIQRQFLNSLAAHCCYLRFKPCFTNGTVLYIMDEIVKFSCSNRVLFLLTFPACRNECVNAAFNFSVSHCWKSTVSQ